MSETAADRKKAKEAYLKALQDQKISAVNNTDDSHVGQNYNKPVVQHELSAAEKRQQMLEEKRRNFFDKKPTDVVGVAPPINNQVSLPTSVQPSQAVPTLSLNVQSLPSQPSAHDVNLNEWRSKGFPSEYAYAKDLGLLQQPPQPKATPLALPTVREQPPSFQFSAPIDYSQPYNPSQAVPHMDVRKPSSEHKTPSVAFPSQATATDEKELKRLKQEEHSRALQADQATRINQQDQQRHASYGRGGGGSESQNATDDSHMRKVQQQQEYARQLEQQQQFQQNVAHQQQKPSASMVPSFNIGGAAVSDKEAKRLKQEEYARQLDQESNYARQTSHDKHRNGGGGGGGLGLAGLGGRDELSPQRKAQQQQEYARQLDMQAVQHKQLQQQQYDHSSPNRGGRHDSVEAVPSFNIGRAVDSEKEAKRLKQEAYTRGLDEQRQLQQQQQHKERGESNRTAVPSFGDAAQGPGAAVSDKEAKRLKQEEYARQLDQESNYARQLKQQQQNPYSDYGHRGGGYGDRGGGEQFGAPPNALDSNEAARLKKVQAQQEYARQLDAEKNFSKPQNRHDRDSHAHQQNQQSQYGDGGNNGYPSNPPPADSNEAARLRKVQAQQEYARQLDAEKNFSKPQNKHTVHNQQQSHQIQPLAEYGMGALNDQHANENAAKRAKQQEYARALLEQQAHQQAAKNDSGRNGKQQHQSNKGFDNVMAAGGGLDAGWVMGPMGIPVRKTLEVGNRGAQRAFSNQTAMSPKKHQHPSDTFGVPGAASQDAHYNPYSQQPSTNSGWNPPPGDAYGGGMPPGGSMLHNPYQQPAANPFSPNQFNPNQVNHAGLAEFPGAAGPAVAGQMPGQDLDERAARERALKAEQARALIEQIAANKRAKAAEKKKLEDEDEAWAAKMEQQRQELLVQAEREKKEKKQRELEELQRAQAQQMEEKRSAKEAQEQREREADRKENEKLRREADALAQQERDEIRREQQQQQLNNSPYAAQRSHLSPRRDQQPEPQPSGYSEAKKTLFDPPSAIDRKNKNGLFDPPSVNNSIESIPSQPVVRTAKNRSKLSSQQGSPDRLSRPTDIHQSSPARAGYFKEETPRVSSRQGSRGGAAQQRIPSAPSPSKHNVTKTLQSRLTTEDEEESLHSTRSQHKQLTQVQQKSAWDMFAGGDGSSERSLQEHRQQQEHFVDSESQVSPRPLSIDTGSQHELRPRQQLNKEQQTTARAQYSEPAATIKPTHQAPVSRPPAHQKQQHQVEENQYQPHRHINSTYQDLGSSGRLDRTLDNVSRFILPGGAVFTAGRKEESSGGDELSRSLSLYNNYMEEAGGETRSNKQQALGGLSSLLPNMNWNQSIAVDRDSGAKGSGAVEINRDTEALIAEFHSSLSNLDKSHSSFPTAAAVNSSGGGLLGTEDDVERVLRKNRRKLAVLDKLNGANPQAGFVDEGGLEDLYDSIHNISSRPTTAGSTRPATVFNAPVLQTSRGSISARDVRNVGGGEKMSAADEYMHNYRLNKEREALLHKDGRKGQQMASQLTKLNLAALLETSPEDMHSALRSNRPHSGGVAGGLSGRGAASGYHAPHGVASIQQQQKQREQQSGAVKRPISGGYLSARGRSVLDHHSSSASVLYHAAQQQQKPSNGINDRGAYQDEQYLYSDEASEVDYSEYGL